MGSQGLLWSVLGVLGDPLGLLGGAFEALCWLLRRPGAHPGCPDRLQWTALGASWDVRIELSSGRELNFYVFL